MVKVAVVGDGQEQATCAPFIAAHPLKSRVASPAFERFTGIKP